MRARWGDLIMRRKLLFQQVAAEISIFRTVEQKEIFLFVVGALTMRLISLQKAAEIMEMETETCLKILELMGIQFSYLAEDDVPIERDW